MVALFRAPGGHRHASLLQKELAHRVLALESAEVGYRLQLLVRVVQELLGSFKPHRLYGFEYRLSGRLAKAHFGIDARAWEQLHHVGCRKPYAGLRGYQLQRGDDFGVMPRNYACRCASDYTQGTVNASFIYGNATAVLLDLKDDHGRARSGAAEVRLDRGERGGGVLADIRVQR